MLAQHRFLKSGVGSKDISEKVSWIQRHFSRIVVEPTKISQISVEPTTIFEKLQLSQRSFPTVASVHICDGVKMFTGFLQVDFKMFADL